MGYLESLSEHWDNSIARAKSEGANEVQIQALESLADYEFGYGTNMRLRKECFWQTRVDKDGDLVLFFAAPWKIGEGGKAIHGQSIRVAIDHCGILTQKNLVTGASFIHDPYPEYLAWSKNHPYSKMVWTLDNKMMGDLVEPGLVPITCVEGDALLIMDTRERIYPFYPSANFATRHNIEQKVKLTHLNVTSRWDGPLSGSIRVDGETHYFTLAHEDDVSGTRVYALHRALFSELLKSTMNSILVELENKVNRFFKTKLRFPRFKFSACSKMDIVGYFA